MKVYINYADKAFVKQQNFSLKRAKKVGNFDKIIGYSQLDIDETFYHLNKHILEQKRGGGYWLWKPYFIYKTLQEMNDNDYLFYSDSGAFFLKSVDLLINELEKYNQDIMGFELPLVEKQWTKQELFNNLNCDNDNTKESNQIMASFQLIRKTTFSLNFYKQYLEYSCNEINITDKYDAEITQDVSYIDHRHDQSIFSLLYKKYNLKVFKDPSQLGKYPRGYSGSTEDDFVPNKLYILANGRYFKLKLYDEKYDSVLYHNRKLNPILGYMRYKLREILYHLGMYKGLVR